MSSRKLYKIGDNFIQANATETRVVVKWTKIHHLSAVSKDTSPSGLQLRFRETSLFHDSEGPFVRPSSLSFQFPTRACPELTIRLRRKGALRISTPPSVSTSAHTAPATPPHFPRLKIRRKKTPRARCYCIFQNPTGILKLLLK